MRDVFQLLHERSDFFWGLIAEHIQISFIAIVIAIVIGLCLGILISEKPKLAEIVLSVINFVYTIPAISMLGLLIPLSGVGNLTAIIALSLYALLPVVRNVHAGLTNIDPRLVEAAEGMGCTPAQLLFKVKLPLAFPHILVGIQNMAVMVISLAGIASFIGAGGLGVAIYRGITTNNMPLTVAGSLLIAGLALLANYFFGLSGKQAKRRNRRNAKLRRRASIVFLGSFMLLGLSINLFHGFSSQDKKTVIRVATKPMTEQHIIGEMLKLIIEDQTDLKVELHQGVGGGTTNIQIGMENGEYDLYPEYTGTAWNNVLKEKDIFSRDRFPLLKQGYEDRYQFTWRGMYGFENNYGLAVRRELADRYALQTISDLSRAAADFTFGASYDFYEREDGFKGLSSFYDLKFKKTMDIDIGLRYKAMADKDIDVMPVFTTDGQLSIADLVILKDDLHYYPTYDCGNIVRLEVLERYPELGDALDLTDRLISAEEMVDLNYQVEVQHRDPRAVALQFLREKQLLRH